MTTQTALATSPTMLLAFNQTHARTHALPVRGEGGACREALTLDNLYKKDA